MSDSSRIDRRTLLRAAGAAALGGVAGGVLAGCGGNNPAPAASRKAVRSLRIGATDPTKGTGVDPRSVGQGATTMVLYHLYDVLMSLDDDKYVYGLAESVEPNADGTKWTIRIRDGARFHDNRPVTAADVAYSLRTLASPPSNRAIVYGDLDLTGMAVRDPRTLEVPLKRPRGDFREGVLVTFSPVFPDGTTDFTKGIGSGPYRLQGVDGKNVRLTAFDGYRGTPPAIKDLEFIRIDDPAARLNGLKSGQIDYAVAISAVGAAAEKGNPAVQVNRAGVVSANALSFAMNQTIAPFNDPRVRRALRLAVDRDQLVGNALLGLGSTGDDLVGKGLPGYATDVARRARDVAQARQLLQAAGVTQLTIRAADIVPGMLSATRLFAQQLAEVGVTLTVQQVPVDSFYADLPALRKVPFQTFYYANRPAATHLANVTSQTSFFNVTGTGPDYWKQLGAAQTIVDDARRTDAFLALQRELYDGGGDVLWAYQDQLDASIPGVKDVKRRAQLPVFHAATVG